MKYFIYSLVSIILAITMFSSCEESSENDDKNDSINTTTNISGTWEGSWYFDFNGTIDGGEGFDVIKSKIDNKIYICGAFLHVNNNWDMKNLTRWDPSTNTWEQVPGIDYYQNNFIRCVTEDSDGNLYFGGDFSSIGDVKAGRVAKFQVSTGKWSALRDKDFYSIDEEYGPISGGVYAIAYLNNYIYIGGYTFNSDSAALRYIRRYNLATSKWEAVGGGVNGKVSCFASDGSGNLYVGGQFTEAGGVAVNNIAKWDGSSWSALGEGTDNYVLSVAYANSKLYAGGSFRNVGGSVVSQGIASWNGTEWQAMGRGVYASWGNSYSVQDICIDTEGKVYICGGFDKDYDTDANLNHVGVYSGGAWHAMGTGLATSSSQIVNASYADGKNVYFVGYFTRGEGNPNDKVNTAIWNETVGK
ncbi:MAG: hypothetical protein JXB49_37085 [Bacteroidales bacterium]|nr:hypothetical protein [Bacteroidales bacterium]